MGLARTLIIAMIAMIAMTLTGCDWPFRSDYRDRLSSVGSVTAPDTVAVGSDFEVAFPTFGTNGCWRKGDDRVIANGPMQVGIWPHDQEYVGANGCTDNEPVFQHSVRLRASARGTLAITVFTRARSSAGRDSVGAIQLSVQVAAN
jgi:hypothetical protein